MGRAELGPLEGWMHSLIDQLLGRSQAEGWAWPEAHRGGQLASAERVVTGQADAWEVLVVTACGTWQPGREGAGEQEATAPLTLRCVLRGPLRHPQLGFLPVACPSDLWSRELPRLLRLRAGSGVTLRTDPSVVGASGLETLRGLSSVRGLGPPHRPALTLPFSENLVKPPAERQGRRPRCGHGAGATRLSRHRLPGGTAGGAGEARGPSGVRPWPQPLRRGPGAGPVGS